MLPTSDIYTVPIKWDLIVAGILVWYTSWDHGGHIWHSSSQRSARYQIRETFCFYCKRTNVKFHWQRIVAGFFSLNMIYFVELAYNKFGSKGLLKEDLRLHFNILRNSLSASQSQIYMLMSPIFWSGLYLVPHNDTHQQLDYREFYLLRWLFFFFFSVSLLHSELNSVLEWLIGLCVRALRATFWNFSVLVHSSI